MEPEVFIEAWVNFDHPKGVRVHVQARFGNSTIHINETVDADENAVTLALSTAKSPTC